jgi:hypothetical protein
MEARSTIETMIPMIDSKARPTKLVAAYHSLTDRPSPLAVDNISDVKLRIKPLILLHLH